MGLSSDLLSQFAKITNDKQEENKETTLYGTAVKYNGKQYVKLDGSDLLTPVETTVHTKQDDRVIVNVQNHTATVTGNLTAPSANSDDIDNISDQISEFDIVIADKVSAEELEAERARIDTLVSENANIKDTLTASNAKIEALETDNVTIKETLEANKADIDDLSANKLSADVADITYATIEGLAATDAKINNLESTYGDFEQLSTEHFSAIDAEIEKLSTTNLDTKYANIDFANIGEAAVKKIFSDTGLIKDIIVGDGTITGELVGVTIKGDLIEGNTVVADKLVIKGEDGIYYKLNTDGVTTEAEQTDYNSINGSIITAKSITATKIAVDDLVAFDATIGGFNITNSSIYSGVKSSVNNGTRGIYLDRNGQMAVGDSTNYIKYFKDTDGKYKLDISAKSITMSSSGTTIEDTISDMQSEMQTMKDEITTVLRIDSSRGTVFKNNEVSTVLSVVIYRGSKRITDITTLKEELGNSAYLQWSWQRMDDETFGTIISTDSRLSNDGFSLTLSPEDVDTKATFMCQLITD